MNLIPFTPTPPHYAIIDASTLGENSKAKYRREIDKLIETGIDPLSQPEELRAYAADLPHSSRAVLKAALNLLHRESRVSLKAAATPGNLAEIQARLYNLDAMTETIKVRRAQGEKTHIWLSREQVEQITAIPGLTTVRGLRDYVILATLLAAGLRRSELASLTFDDLMQQPSKDGMRDVLSIRGKGDKPRTVPISAKLARHIRAWRDIAGPGLVTRAINKSGVVNGSLTDKSIGDIVHRYGEMIGVPELEAHDLRRTFARTGYDAGVPVEQISKLLGHADLETTMLYLGISVDIDSTVSDFIPISGD